MRVEVEGTINTSFRIEGHTLIYGPPGSGKSSLLRALYLHLSLLNQGCPKAFASSFLISNIGDLMKHGVCKGEKLVSCSFEIPLVGIKEIVDSLTLVLRSAFRSEKLDIIIDGKDVFDIIKNNVGKLCNLKVKTGPLSSLETRCEGGVVVGTWSWASEEEIPFPPDVLAETLLPTGISMVTYLPQGRQDLAVVKEVKGPQDIICFVREHGDKDPELNGTSLEKAIFRESLRNYSFVIIDDLLGDKYSLDTLREILKGVGTIVASSKDERVKKLFQDFKLTVVELSP